MPPSEDISPFEMACRATCTPEFTRALDQLRVEKVLTHRQLAAKTNGKITKSTVLRLCTVQLPKRANQLQAFLAACDEPAEEITQWVKEWQRLLAG